MPIWPTIRKKRESYLLWWNWIVTVCEWSWKRLGIWLSVLLSGQMKNSSSPLQWSSGINLNAGYPKRSGSYRQCRCHHCVLTHWSTLLISIKCRLKVVLDNMNISNINPLSLRWCSGIYLDAEWPEASGVLHSVSQSSPCVNPFMLCFMLCLHLTWHVAPHLSSGLVHLNPDFHITRRKVID